MIWEHDCQHDCHLELLLSHGNNMVSLFQNHFVIRKKMFLFQMIGACFLCVPGYCSVARHYVFGSLRRQDFGAGANNDGMNGKQEDERFSGEARSLLYLSRNENLTRGIKESFYDFHDYSLNSGLPMASILANP